MSFIRIIENNIFAIGRYWGNIIFSSNGDNGIYSMATGIEVDDLNWTWNERSMRGKSDANFINNIKQNYDDLNMPFWWWVYPCGNSESTRETLLDSGFVLRKEIPCMALYLESIPFEMQMSNYLDVSIVKDDDQLNAWEQTSFAGFDMPHQTRGQYNKFLNSFDIKKNCRQKLFIAYWHGKPAATALLFFQDDIVGIYFVTTLASYRGNGIASTLVSAVMKYAKSCGSKYCVLQSSEKGLNVYLRAGFKEYCRADVYSLSDQFQDPT